MRAASAGPDITVRSWVRATAIGWFLGFLVMLALILVGELVGAYGQAMIGIGIGAGVGYWQSRLLRGRLERPRRWAVATVVGLGLPFVVWDVSTVFGRDTVFSHWLPLCVSSGGLLVALWQWRLLRPQAGHAAWWIPACWIGWTLPVLAIVLSDSAVIPAPWDEVFRLGGMFFGGVMLGAATAPPLVRMLRGVAPLALALALFAPADLSAQGPAPPPSELRVVSGVLPSGLATEQWLAMLRRRLPRDRYDSVAALRKAVTPAEASWARLIDRRVAGWAAMVAPLAALFAPVPAPPRVLIVVGNRGAEDAFTHDVRTIGFDLAALQVNYGDAGLPENAARLDRFFRHEFVHLLQKAWLVDHPWPSDTPLRAALADIWAEGLGNYYSLSARWRMADGVPSAAATGARAELEPRLVARLAAVACAPAGAAAPLLADLSWGRFDQKWGALPAALWLEAEPEPTIEALRRFVVAGPDGVWALADRHLSEDLRAVLREVRVAESLCGAR